MSPKPIFVATHPRAISTAFERVFMTQRDTIKTVHEPFGDAYYYGPERLAERYAHDEAARKESGFSDTTYKHIMDSINRDNQEEKRVLIKDMAQYFIPPDNRPASIAPSIGFKKRGIGTEEVNGSPKLSRRNSLKTRADIDTGVQAPSDAPYATYTEPGNPTVIPFSLLEQFHFVFLIRHPKNSIPSYYRCCIPPLNEMTGFHCFRKDEAGYVELRRLFDFLQDKGLIGPERLGAHKATNGFTNGEAVHAANPITVIDADDLLSKPAETIQLFCESVGIQYSPDMLCWDSQEEEDYAAKAFQKWKGFHEDVIRSRLLQPKAHTRSKSVDESYIEWVSKYGREGADIIRESVDENIEHYEHLKQFSIKV